MDLAYQLSEHPVALIGRPLKTASELHFLSRILAPSAATSLLEAKEALWLLCEITRDKWWERAWTFQENYHSGPRMRLLMRHDASLELEKLRHH